MCKHLVMLSILIVGTGWTLICAGSGLTRLLSLGSCHLRRPPTAEMKTVLIRLENVDAEEAADVLKKAKTKRGEVGVNRAEQLVRITDLPRNVERLKRILREVDSPPIGGDRVGVVPLPIDPTENGPIELPVAPPSTFHAADRAP
jgi:type II secretory pathway component GspD/PulD (secretin)